MSSAKNHRQRKQSLPSGRQTRGKTSFSGTSRGDAGPAHPAKRRGPLARFRAANPVLKFALLFGGLLGLFYLIYVPFSQTEAYQSYLRFIAQIASASLRLIGYDVAANGSAMVSDRCMVKIVPGCDAMEALALFGSAVLASPVALRSRITFLLGGTAGLLAVNTFRIVTLFLVGIYYPRSLETIHWDVWPGVLIFLVMACWLLWARRAVAASWTAADASK